MLTLSMSFSVSAEIALLPDNNHYYQDGDAFPQVDTPWVDQIEIPDNGFAEVVPGRAKVRFKDHFIWSQDAATIMLRTGVAFDYLKPLNFGYVLLDIRFLGKAERPSEDDTLKLVAMLRQDQMVRNTEADAWMKAYATPTDPRFNEMWHLRSIGAEAGWDVTTGGGQEVCVIDTGTLLQHEDLVSRIEDGYDFISSPQSGGDGNGRDDNEFDEGGGSGYHGSHVAGTILAEVNNGKGIPGLNWSAKLVTGRALGVTGGGSSSDIADAILWCSGYDVNGVTSRTRPVDVINMSLGSHTNCDSYTQQVVTAAEDAGVIVVSATGNSPSRQISMPANCTGSLAVAAYGGETNRRRSSYSTFGDGVDVVAPGGDGSGSQTVLSITGPSSTTYKWSQGTSMATPHAAGVISLMLDLDPNLTRTEIKALFDETGTASCQNCNGKPILNMEGLLNAIDPVAGGGDEEETEEDPPPNEEEEENDPPPNEEEEEDSPSDDGSDDDDETRRRPELVLGGEPDEDTEFRTPVIVDGGEEGENVYIPPDGSGYTGETTNGYVPPTQRPPVYNQPTGLCQSTSPSVFGLFILLFGCLWYLRRSREPANAIVSRA